MRTFLLPIAGAVLVTGICCGEFDATDGIPSAKPRATQATGVTFGDGMAANPRGQKRMLIEEEAAFVRIAAMRAV
jgi:hypothetical protein